MNEFFIRFPGSDEAKGPFDLEQLQSLAEAGKVNKETLFYHEETEDWVPMHEMPDLVERLFPEKRKLSFRRASEGSREFSDASSEDASREEVRVDEILAAAEGETEGTSHKKRRRVWRERTANYGRLTLSLGLLLLGATQILIYLDRLIPFEDVTLLLRHPLILIGIFDFLAGILVLLGSTGVYPVIRARMALGGGIMAYSFYSWGQPELALVAVAISIGFYVMSITLNFFVYLLCLAAGLGGSIYLIQKVALLFGGGGEGG